MSRIRSGGARIVRGAVGIAVFLAVAEAAARTGLVDSSVPPASEIVIRAAGLMTNPEFIDAVGATMLRWAVGLLLTIAVVVPLGIVLGTFRQVERTFRPIIEVMRPMPSIALIPLAILLFRDNFLAEVSIVVYASTWPVLINTMYAVREVDPLARETMRSFGFGPGSILLRVSLPSAAPFILTGIRISSSIALIVAISTELFAPGFPGIGSYLLAVQSGTDIIPGVIATAVWAGVIGLALNGLFVAFDRRFFRWHHARGGEVT
ncbi:ABC transporter permease [Thermopolyspora sp. NPDC052614]|uniref:ABC transporter permease n=1 Tax=Thermopolyspora sp. NPDC052614 TaxID=3155682 RepID=UPI003416D5A4